MTTKAGSRENILRKDSLTQILMISHSNSKGGAARAASRLFNCLTKENCHVEFLVAKKYGNNNSVSTISAVQNLALVFLSRLDKFICNILEPGGENWKSGAFFGVLSAKKLNKKNVDVINLHWIGHGLISLRQLNKIEKPVVWTLHDEWLLNAISHYPQENKSQRVPHGFIRSYILEKRIRTKKKFISKNNVNLITINSSVARQIKTWCPESKIYTVVNPVDTSEFFPRSDEGLRSIMQLSDAKPIVLFLGGTGDPRKGWDLLEQSLDLCHSNFDLLMIGEANKKLSGKSNQINIKSFQPIDNNAKLSQLYSIATAVVIPSRFEGLPQVATEALCCATPIIGFDIGGLKDIIIENKNGHLVSRFDSFKLAKAIDLVVSNKKDFYRKFCSEFAVGHFSFNAVAQQYITIIDEISS
jgi:glycosyltransferase involved in cell wall biosynthesis